MKRAISFSLMVPCLVAASLPFVVGRVEAQEPLEARLRSHIEYLASDKLEGRGVGSAGLQFAAAYIARHFKEIGLEPAFDDSFMQTFEMQTSSKLEACTLSFTGLDDLKLHEDFEPFSFSDDGEFRGGVVFCGFGIDASEMEHDDFGDTNLEGKVAMVLRGEPSGWASKEDRDPWHATLRNKVYNVKDRGATAILIVNQQPAEGETDSLITFDGNDADDYGIPAIHLTRKAADTILQRGGLDALDVVEARMEEGRAGSAVLGHVACSGKVVFERQTCQTSNVGGILRGTGPHADEYVVVGAHYDHLGKRVPSMRTFKDGKIVQGDKTPQIHNGADDNASGTGALIEVGRILADSGGRDRSYLFLAFTAEETGLHGSKHFIDATPVTHEKMVAMLNMDMVGRLDPKDREVTVFGIGTAKELGSIVEAAGEAEGLKIGGSADAGGRSDHAVFVRKGIPAMHFYSGNHPDYHKPSDDVEKINADGTARITRMVAEIARRLGASDASLTFVEVKTERPKGDPDAMPSYRVVMGLAPGYVEDGKPGMPVDAVNPDGPADLAGMKAGDRIISIGTTKVGNIYDYMAATRKNSPGDVVEVVVLRDGKEVTLSVTLAGAG